MYELRYLALHVEERCTHPGHKNPEYKEQECILLVKGEAEAWRLFAAWASSNKLNGTECFVYQPLSLERV